LPFFATPFSQFAAFQTMGCLAGWIWGEKCWHLSDHSHSGKGAIAKSGNLFFFSDEAIHTSVEAMITNQLT